MKLTVFGSTGRTGRLVLEEGTRRGHEMTAFTRRSEAISGELNLARVVTGDGREPEAVAAGVAGADAVIAIVSAESRKGPHQTEEVARVITEAMADAGVRRFVITSAYPVAFDNPRLPVMILRRVLRDAYADLAGMERVVAATDLDWTIARFPRLVDKPAKGGVLISRGRLAKPNGITRADVANTLVDLAEQDTYARAAVNVAG